MNIKEKYIGMSRRLFYRLDHRHIFSNCEETMHIGTFSSYENADKVIDELVNQPGFELFPRSCFIITKVEVDDYLWKNGFISTQAGDKEIK